MLGEKIACAAISPHLHILLYVQVQCHPPLWQLHSVMGDFSNEVCYVKKITVAESNPDMGLVT